MSKAWWIAGGVGFLLLLGGGAMTYAHFKQRGIRNNNPGNIRLGTNWKGLAAQQTDGAFAQFTSPEYGIRAMTKILRTYMGAYGLRTVAGIISRWAPPNENDTTSYIETVARAVGKPASAPLTDADLVPLIAAIIRHENGVQPYPENVIRNGVAMA